MRLISKTSTVAPILAAFLTKIGLYLVKKYEASSKWLLS